MRITEQNKYLSVLNRIRTQQSAAHAATEEVSSGKRINRPSDDPVGAAMIDRIRESSARHDTYVKTGQMMESYYNRADAALDAAGYQIDSAKQLAIQLGSGPQSATVMNDAAEQIAQIKSELTTIANSKHQGSFMFGGVADGQEPFDTFGVYNGSTTLRSVEVGHNTSIGQVDGNTIFSGGGAGEDAFQVLNDMEVALRSGDQVAVRSVVDRLDTAFEQINSGRQRIGNSLDTIDQARAFSENMIFSDENEAGAIESADFAEAASRMQQAQNALEATYRATSQMNNMRSLLDF